MDEEDLIQRDEYRPNETNMNQFHILLPVYSCIHGSAK